MRGALFPLVCARFSAIWVDEAMKFIVQTNLNWMIRLSRRLWYQVFLSYKLTSVMISDFFIAMWKKYCTLFLEVHLQKSPWCGSLSWFIQKEIQLPAYHSCFVVGLVHEVHDFTTVCTAACLDDMKACNCYCCNLKQKFHSKCSTFSIITR